MDTGIDTRHLYTAYRISANHVHTGNGSTKSVIGTGFLIQDGDAFYLVTNRHIVDLGYKAAKYIGFKVEQIRVAMHTRSDATKNQPDQLTEFAIAPGAMLYHPDDTVDIACAQLSTATVVAGPTNLRLDYLISIDCVADQPFFTETLEVGELVAFPGYPEWFDKNGSRPIMRTGTIVSDPQNDYRLTTGEASRGDGHLQLAFEAFSYGGNSGSPVFVTSRGLNAGIGIIYSGVYHPAMLIGINAGHLLVQDGTHSGLSRMYKSIAILAMIDHLKASAVGSDT